MFIVPPVATLLVKNPLAERYDFTALRDVFCGAAPLSKEIEDGLLARLKLTSIKQGN